MVKAMDDTAMYNMYVPAGIDKGIGVLNYMQLRFWRKLDITSCVYKLLIAIVLS